MENKIHYENYHSEIRYNTVKETKSESNRIWYEYHSELGCRTTQRNSDTLVTMAGDS